MIQKISNPAKMLSDPRDQSKNIFACAIFATHEKRQIPHIA
jgi:hypothetical protein